jgi:hypothetical protein
MAWGLRVPQAELLQCDQYLATVSPDRYKEVAVSIASIRALTWATLVAALLSAVLLAGEDAGLPDLTLSSSERR